MDHLILAKNFAYSVWFMGLLPLLAYYWSMEELSPRRLLEYRTREVLEGDLLPMSELSAPNQCGYVLQVQARLLAAQAASTPEEMMGMISCSAAAAILAISQLQEQDTFQALHDACQQAPASMPDEMLTLADLWPLLGDMALAMSRLATLSDRLVSWPDDPSLEDELRMLEEHWEGVRPAQALVAVLRHWAVGCGIILSRICSVTDPSEIHFPFQSD